MSARILRPVAADQFFRHPGVMPKQRNWNWEETLVAFRLYCQTPYGKLHQHNPDIIDLAARINRTPSAVGMKACNFASLDPVHRARGVKGLPNRSQLEHEVWERFHADSEAVAAEAEDAYERLLARDATETPAQPEAPDGPSDEIRSVRVRRVQSFFRTTVMLSYGNRCALTGLNVPSLLNASHIIPWASSPKRRADPHNGLCLNALHDRAFDRGLISLDDDLRVLISPALIVDGASDEMTAMLPGYAGKKLRAPDRFQPDSQALAHHREHVFQHA